MINTEPLDLNKFPKDYKNITTIYGEAGSGKTTLCLLAAIEQALDNKRVLFLDAGKNFSTERFEQLLNERNKSCIKDILVLNIKNFNLQHTQIKKLERIKNVSLIVVDSITHFYRRLYSREPEIAKAMLGKQLSILKKISKNNTKIIVTSQVYSDMKNNIKPLAKEMLENFSKSIIKLEKEPKRRIIWEKPEIKSRNFKILNNKIEIF